MGSASGIENPCFCISLRCGVQVIAVLDVVFGLLGVCGGIYGIVTAATDNSSQLGEANATSVDSSTEPVPTSSDSKDEHSQAEVLAVLTLFVIYCLAQIGFGAILILALTKEKLFFYKSWLFFRFSGLLFTIATFVCFIFLREKATIQPTIFDGISALVSIYCIFCVYVMMNEIKKQAAGPVKPYRG